MPVTRVPRKRKPVRKNLIEGRSRVHRKLSVFTKARIRIKRRRRGIRGVGAKARMVMATRRHAQKTRKRERGARHIRVRTPRRKRS